MSNALAAGRMWLLSAWHAANETKELNLKFYLILIE